MDDSVLNEILEAEKKAAESIASAREQAFAAVAEAEKKAGELRKTCEAECARMIDEGLDEAQRISRENYVKSVEKARAEGEAYAKSVLDGADKYVDEIVGRVCK